MTDDDPAEPCCVDGRAVEGVPVNSPRRRHGEMVGVEGLEGESKNGVSKILTVRGPAQRSGRKVLIVLRGYRS